MVNSSLCWNRNFLVARCRCHDEWKDGDVESSFYTVIYAFAATAGKQGRGGGWGVVILHCVAHDEAVSSFGRNNDLSSGRD
jgi:hypothetical protein